MTIEELLRLDNQIISISNKTNHKVLFWGNAENAWVVYREGRGRGSRSIRTIETPDIKQALADLVKP